MNKLVIPIFLAIIFSLFSGPSLANAEIKVTPPLNWQPGPNNNSTSVLWLQNSTKSAFAIAKVPDYLSFPIFLTGRAVAQAAADEGVLESIDQISFGRSNYGYRYFLNLSAQSEFLNSPNGVVPNILSKLPEALDVPFKGMMILTEKQGDLYLIVFLSPRENFDSIFNSQIKPTLDSIQLSNSTVMN